MGNRNFSKKQYTLAALVGSLALLVALTGAAIGRYQHQFYSEGSVRAKEFYFTSNFLDGETHTLGPGSTEVTFSLGNHADELRFSEVDIAYEVTVTPMEGTVANDLTVEYSNESKKLPCTGVQDHSVTIKELTPGKYTVTATGTGGYQQTLTAVIEVLSQEPVVYMHLDTTHSEYVLLTVWAQGYTGDVTITPPTGMIPDNTDPVMRDAKTGQVFTDRTSFQGDAYSSHVYRFFGSGATTANFTVTYDDKTADVKAPG